MLSRVSISDPERVKAARNMSEMWSTFSQTGRPAARGQPVWPPWALDKRKTMEIDAQCRAVEDPYRHERNMWERLEPQRTVLWFSG
jgi:para-nitrobenzyl esterase